MTIPNVFTYVYEQKCVHKCSQRRLQLNLATRDILRIFTMLEQVSTDVKIKVMSKHFTAAVETALFFNTITVARAIELGISEEALQQIEQDKINAACMAS